MTRPTTTVVSQPGQPAAGTLKDAVPATPSADDRSRFDRDMAALVTAEREALPTYEQCQEYVELQARQAGCCADPPSRGLLCEYHEGMLHGMDDVIEGRVK